MNRLQKIKKLRQKIEYDKALLRSGGCFKVKESIFRRIRFTEEQVRVLERS